MPRWNSYHVTHVSFSQMYQIIFMEPSAWALTDKWNNSVHELYEQIQYSEGLWREHSLSRAMKFRTKIEKVLSLQQGVSQPQKTAFCILGNYPTYKIFNSPFFSQPFFYPQMPPSHPKVHSRISQGNRLLKLRKNIQSVTILPSCGLGFYFYPLYQGKEIAQIGFFVCLMFIQWALALSRELIWSKHSTAVSHLIPNNHRGLSSFTMRTPRLWENKEFCLAHVTSPRKDKDLNLGRLT